MAKNINPFFRFKGRFNNMVFVNSKAYGDHVRSPRGTFKPAPVNNVLGANVNRTALLNNAAKRLHDVLKVYYGKFKATDVWSKLLSRMRACASNEFVDLLKATEGLNMNDEYPMRRFNFIPLYDVRCSEEEFFIDWKNCFYSAIDRHKKYLLEWCVIFFTDMDDEGNFATVQTEARGEQNAGAPLHTCAFTKPADAKYYVVLAKVVKGKGSGFNDDTSSMGIEIMRAGEI